MESQNNFNRKGTTGVFNHYTPIFRQKYREPMQKHRIYFFCISSPSDISFGCYPVNTHVFSLSAVNKESF